MMENKRNDNDFGLYDNLNASVNEFKTATILASNFTKAIILKFKAWLDKLFTTISYLSCFVYSNCETNKGARLYFENNSFTNVFTDFDVELDIELGSALLHCMKMKDAKLYVWQYCIVDTPTLETEWINAQETIRASVLLTKLIPLTKYWFRVVVLTNNGCKVISLPILKFIA
jgi:hypothetical protein